MPKSTWGLAAAILMLLTLACNLFTPQPVCTPPACRADEVYFCPGDCPGGCGTTCATPTPGETTLPPQCTPPACRADEVYFCPGDCPGGCGTICATPMPLSPQDSSQDPFGQPPGGTLWRLPVSGEAVQLTTLSGMFLFNTMEDLLWSPDRTQLAYEDNGTLFIAGWDGSTPRAYVSGNARFIGWAPGHSRFAFWQTEPTEVWIGEPGQVPQRVTSPTGPAAIADLRWVDENTYVYVTGEPEAYTLGIGTVGGLARDIAISNSKFVSLDVRP